MSIEASPSASGSGGGDLSAYVGKYPLDPVNGVAWAANPRVIGSVRATLADPALAARVLDYTGPATPIAQVEGKVVAGNCDARDCSARNWEVLVDLATGAAEVCYHDEAATPGKSVWYLPGGRQERRSGGCAIG